MIQRIKSISKDLIKIFPQGIPASNIDNQDAETALTFIRNIKNERTLKQFKRTIIVKKMKNEEINTISL